MLRSLTSLLKDEVEPHGGVDDRTLETSGRVLLESALYRTALEQITDASVQVSDVCSISHETSSVLYLHL